MANQEMVRQLLASMDMMKKVHMHRFDIDGLNKSEFSLLMSIRDQADGAEEGVMASSLSAKHHISKPAVSQTVSALEKKGMVVRRPDAQDRRVVRIHLTPAGEDVLQCVGNTFQQYIARLVEKLGEQDTRELIRLFGRLYEVLREMLQEDGQKQD